MSLNFNKYNVRNWGHFFSNLLRK